MPATKYTFGSDLEGWRIYNAGTGTFGTPAGNSFQHTPAFGGVAAYSDLTGADTYLASPVELSGDARWLTGGDVSFRFRNQDIEGLTPDVPISSIEVILVSNSGTTLTANIPLTTTTGIVDLTANVNFDAATFGVSSSAFDAVMEDLSFFGIDGNSRSLDEVTIIDNDTFTPSASGNGVVDGSIGDDSMGVGFVDDGGDAITGGSNFIRTYAGDDTVDAGFGNDTIEGGEGDDSLTAYDGNDLLIGGEGNDTLNVSFGSVGSGYEGGSDSAFGGAGDDYFWGGFGGGEVYDGGDDNDTLDFSNRGTAINANLTSGNYSLGSSNGTITNIENFVGGFGNDTITGDGEDNILDGGPAGNDTISAVAGNDTLLGGDGTDSLVGGDGNDSLQGGNGRDTLIGGEGNDVIDTFTGTAGFEAGGTSSGNADFVDAGAGDDFIRAGFGIDETIISGTGDDTYSAAHQFGPGSLTNLDLEAGTYTTTTSSTGTLSGIENVSGSQAADSIAGDAGDNQLFGNGGNDTVIGRGGDDTITGGDGDDSLVGAGGTTQTIDLITNGDFSATTGTAPNNEPDNWTVSETLPDQVQVVGGTGYFGGGQAPAGGSLTQNIDGATIGQNVEVNFDYFEVGGPGDVSLRILFTDGNGTAVLDQTVTNAGSYSFNFTATTTDYTVQIIDNSANSFNTDARIDNFEVLVPDPSVSDNDSIDGGAGTDSIYGYQGDDTLLGGSGNDLLIGDDGGTGGSTFNDSLDGGAGDDTLWANEGDDTLLGGTGNDLMQAQEGDDSLFGGDGEDTLFGGIGDDTLFGGDGADRLDGGPGNSTLDGGGDNDTIFAYGDQGNIFVTGGETGLDDDTLDLEDFGGSTGAEVNLTGFEAGNATIGTASVTFSEIERIDLTSSNDTVTADQDADVSLDAEGGTDTVDITGTVINSNVTGFDDTASGMFTDETGTVVAFGGGTGVTLSSLLNGTYIPPGETEALGAKGDYQITGGDRDGQVGTVDLTGFEEVNFSVVCFTAGTHIATPDGPRAVETLSAGDSVLTQDNGSQDIRWIGTRHFSAADLAARPELRPIRIERGALGDGLPERDLIVSPQHRVLLRSKVAGRMFGSSEVLVPAKKLAGMIGISVVDAAEDVTYVHFLCDQHELVWSEGAVTETLYTGEQAMKTLSSEARAEIFAIFPELENAPAEAIRPLARPVPPGKHIRKLVERIAKNGRELVEVAA